MRFQIDDRVKLVFPNGFSESSFAPRITQNFRLVGKQFIPFAIRVGVLQEAVGKQCLCLSSVFLIPFFPLLSPTHIHFICSNIDRVDELTEIEVAASILSL